MWKLNCNAMKPQIALCDSTAIIIFSISKLINQDFSYLESEKTKITIEYIIENEGSQ